MLNLADILIEVMKLICFVPVVSVSVDFSDRSFVDLSYSLELTVLLWLNILSIKICFSGLFRNATCKNRKRTNIWFFCLWMQ